MHYIDQKGQWRKDKKKNLFQINSANLHIGMISEGSRDTEDWSNDADNSALYHRNKWHFKTL